MIASPVCSTIVQTHLQIGVFLCNHVATPSSIQDYDVRAEDLAMVSLNREDRIRLVDFPDVGGAAGVVRGAIARGYQREPPGERSYHGAHEFKARAGGEGGGFLSLSVMWVTHPPTHPPKKRVGRQESTVGSWEGGHKVG